MYSLLVPLDGSACADQVLPTLAPLARALQAPIHLLRVIDMPSLGQLVLTEGYPISSESELMEGLRCHAEAELALRAELLRAQGLTLTTSVQVGHPAETIVEVAETQKAVLIAMATHGYTGLRRWTLGSVTDKVLHAAPAPVFVVRSVALLPDSIPAFRRILVPLDGSSLARQALPFAVSLASTTGAELLLLEVLPPDLSVSHPELLTTDSLAQRYREGYAESLEHTQHGLELLAEELSAQGIRTQMLVCAGNPATTIVHQAEQCGADLVVMATHGYSGLQRWDLGSVADKVLHACLSPLLLVRAGEVRG